MENKLIHVDNDDLDIQYHPDIKGLQIVEGKNNFPFTFSQV